MAESSLSIGLPELKAEVGHFLGHGRGGVAFADWVARTPDPTDEVLAVIQSGIRRVYYPPAISEGINGYEWSFLRPSTTLDLEDGTGDYDLPESYSQLIGNLHYPADENRRAIVRVRLGAILEMRAREDRSDYPAYVAIRSKAFDATTGQRSEALFWPEPSTDVTVTYSYEAYSGELTDAAPYPLGGMHLSELYIESCLAVAEQRLNNEVGLHTQAYQTLLVDAVTRDRAKGARYYGQMGHREPICQRPRHGDTGGSYPITLGIDGPLI